MKDRFLPDHSGRKSAVPGLPILEPEGREVFQPAEGPPGPGRAAWAVAGFGFGIEESAGLRARKPDVVGDPVLVLGKIRVDPALDEGDRRAVPDLRGVDLGRKRQGDGGTECRETEQRPSRGHARSVRCSSEINLGEQPVAGAPSVGVVVEAVQHPPNVAVRCVGPRVDRPRFGDESTVGTDGRAVGKGDSAGKRQVIASA